MLFRTILLLYFVILYIFFYIIIILECACKFLRLPKDTWLQIKIFVHLVFKREGEKKMWQMVYETYCLVGERGYVFSLSLGTSTSCLNFTYFLSFIALFLFLF